MADRQGVTGGDDPTERLVDEVPRRRVVATLARRWQASVTIVTAAGGFGKSTALRQAIDANRADRHGVDHLVTCRPFDVDAHRFTRRVVDSLGSHAPVEGDDPVVLAGVVVAALGTRSPQPLCLVLDDVHELGDATPAVEVLRVVARALPANAHLVLCGRRLPEGLPLARLRAADRLVELGDDDLGFDDDELTELAARHGVASCTVTDMGGWPALVRLSITAGRRSSLEFLRQELLDDLDDDLRHALGVAVLAGQVDDALLAALGIEVGAAGLAARVPLVDLTAAGAARPHALWRDVLDQILDRRTRDRDVRAIAARLSDAGAHDEVLDLLAGHDLWDDAAAAVLTALRGGDALVGRDQAARWVRCFPADQRGRPEVLVLRGLVARLDVGGRGGPAGRSDGFFSDDGRAGTGTGDDPAALFRRAEDRFGDDGRIAGEAVATIAQVWQAWDEADRGEMGRLHRRITDLDRQQPGVAGPYPDIIGALAASLDGHLEEALATLERVRSGTLDPSTRVFVELQRSALALIDGHGDLAVEAVAAARRAAADRTGTEVGSQDLVVSWLAGDPLPTLRRLETGGRVEVRSPQDRFRATVYINALAGSLGLAQPVDVPALRSQGSGSRRDEAFIAMAAAMSAAGRGEEDEAREHIVAVTSAHGTADPAIAGELRRFLPCAYVLVPELRPWLDSLTVGPTQVRSRALARLVVALREGGPIRWDDVPDPYTVLTWMPLPWSVELAVAAHAAGRTAGLELARCLLDEAGDGARRLLRGEAARDGGGAAERLLTVVPIPPVSPVRIRVLGRLTIDHRDDRPVTEVTRRRVRELLALLVARGELTREGAMAMLWPDLDHRRARNNLNVTLGHLRTALEPGRRAGEASFHLRTIGDRILLHHSAHLAVDLWEARQQTDLARRHEAVGELDDALASYRAAVDGWDGGEPLLDLAYVEGTATDLATARMLLVDAACRGAELAVAAHELAVAHELAERVLAHDPLEERAHRAVLAAALAADDRGAARAALARATAAVEEAGVTLGPETRMLARRLDGHDPTAA